MKLFYVTLFIFYLLASFTITADSAVSTSVTVNTIGLAETKISSDTCWDKIPECKVQKNFFNTLDISTQQKLCNSFLVKELKCELIDPSTVKSILKSAVIAFNGQINNHFVKTNLLTKSKIVDLQVASAEANSSTGVNTEATFKQSGRISNRYAKLSKKLSQVIFENNFSVITSASSSVSSISLQSSTDGKVDGVNLLYRQDDISEILDILDEIDVKEDIESEINSSIAIDAIQKMKQKDASTFKNKAKLIDVACNSISDASAKSICKTSKACKSPVYAKCSSSADFNKCAVDFYADTKNTDECKKADKVLKEASLKITSAEERMKQIAKYSAKFDLSSLSKIKTNAKVNAKNMIETQNKMLEMAKNLAESLKSAFSNAFSSMSSASNSESAIVSQKSEIAISSASSPASDSASASASTSESSTAAISTSASNSVSESASASASVSVSASAVISASTSVSEAASVSVSTSATAANSASASTRLLQNEIILTNNVSAKESVIASDILSNMEKMVTTVLSNMDTIISANKSDLEAIMSENKSNMEAVLSDNKSNMEATATNSVSLIDSLKSAEVEATASIQTLTPSDATIESPTPYDNIESSFGTNAEATLLTDLYNKLVIQSQKSNPEKVQNMLNNLIGLFISNKSINARTPLNIPCFIKNENIRKTIETSYNSSIDSSNSRFSFTTYTKSAIISDASKDVESSIQLKVENQSFEITVANIDAIRVLLISRVNLDGTTRTSLSVKSSTLDFDYQTKILSNLRYCLTEKTPVVIDCSYLPTYSQSQANAITSVLEKFNWKTSSNKCSKTKEERMADSSLKLKFPKVYHALTRKSDITAYLDCFLLGLYCDKIYVEVSSGLRYLAESSYTYAKGSEPDTANSQVTFVKSDISDNDFSVGGSTPSIEAELTTSLSAAINADATAEAQAETQQKSLSSLMKSSMFLAFLLVLIL